jgi:hypothetical protein
MLNSLRKVLIADKVLLIIDGNACVNGINGNQPKNSHLNKYSTRSMTMARFEYTTLLEMTPRPGVKYATVYIKQRPDEYQRLTQWLTATAEDILGILELDADLAAWFSQPHADFRRSRRGEYYSPEDLLTDMIHQLSLGRDLPQAMADRWNRLCEGTPWAIDLVPSMNSKTVVPQDQKAQFV